ncbi:MAG: glycosyltransferase [Frankiales bacterium]|nr:glycosyltransferase [Frankiales bacterium]
MTGSVPPVVTVVVPTVDRVELLRRCLRGLAGQDLADPYEVVVVHDGNAGITALLAEVADDLPVRGLRIDERGVSAKRNAGWRAARADLVAFTDDDCEPSVGWLTALVQAAGDDRALVAGPVAPHPEDAGVTGPWARTVNQPVESGYYPGCNLLLRRSALEATDGFDPAMQAGEDTDLAWRVIEQHGAAAWAPDALIWHAVRAVDFVGHLRSLPRWGDLPLVVRRHPQLRDRLGYRRWFWKDNHPAACLALAGIALTPISSGALLLAAPVVVRRLRKHPPRRAAALAVSDVVEAGVLIAGSIRHRAVLL